MDACIRWLSVALVSDRERVAGFRAVDLKNDLMSVRVLPERGAEIHSLIYAPLSIDVLWKTPWGLKPQRGNDTEAAWLDGYGGGWQELFPNFGNVCVYKGAVLGYHGEASVSEWSYNLAETSDSVADVTFSIRLARSPFRLRRRMILEDGQAVLRLEEQIVNEGAEDMDFVWGHHPAYGSPFLSGDCRLVVPAAAYLPFDSTEQESWSGELRVAGEEQRLFTEGSLSGLSEGRYLLYNDRLKLGIQWTWPADVFPYVWIWRELRGSFGYPWYGQCYVMGVEPLTSVPNQGLISAIETNTAKKLPAGGTLEAVFEIEFVR